MLWGSRVIVPTKGRRRALDMLHEAHPGIVHEWYLKLRGEK